MNLDKKLQKLYIIFPDTHLSYSPTTLHLYDSLSNNFDISIITFTPNVLYSSHTIKNRNIAYLPVTDNKGTPLLKRIATEVKRTIFPKSLEFNHLYNASAKVLINKISTIDGIIIAVDFFALWCVQIANKDAHFISLEIIESDPYKAVCKIEKIKSVIIQSQDRYDYLFGTQKIKTFLIQNAPAYNNFSINITSRKPTDLIFCGSAIPAFGIISCIEFLIEEPAYTLTVKGALPVLINDRIKENFKLLIEQKRLILNDEYLDPSDLDVFISQFYIGFVFYDLNRFDHIDTFNYKTAPSGKLFQYFNSGVPVIGSKIAGLNAIEKFKAGCTIDTLNPGAIRNAIMKISEDYGHYAEGAKNASRYFDFITAVEPYKNYLLGNWY